MIERLKAILAQLSQPSTAAQGLRQSDWTPENIQRGADGRMFRVPPEGVRPGMAPNVNTGRMMNTATNFSRNVGAPVGAFGALTSVIPMIAQLENERVARNEMMAPRGVVPNTEISTQAYPQTQMPATPDEIAQMQQLVQSANPVAQWQNPPKPKAAPKKTASKKPKAKKEAPKTDLSALRPDERDVEVPRGVDLTALNQDEW